MNTDSLPPWLSDDEVLDASLHILAYSHTQPFLRVIDMSKRAVVPLPSPLDRLGYALDYAVARKGFVVLQPDVQTALVHLREHDDAVATDVRAVICRRGGWPALAVDKGLVWVQRPNTGERYLIDGNGAVVRRVKGAAGLTVSGELECGLVLTGMDDAAVALWQPGSEPVPIAYEGTLAAVLPPDRMVVADALGLRLIDQGGSSISRVPLRIGSASVPCLTVSQDRQYAVLDTAHYHNAASFGPTQRIWYCDFAAGQAQPARGTFDGPCYPPVFSARTDVVFIGVMYSGRIVALSRRDLTLREVQVPGNQELPMPLIDIADVA
jgi:hypothetical protein